MKKIILTVAAVFAFGFANAQEFKFGAKTGLNVSTLTGDVEDVKSKIGFHIGGFAEIKFGEKFAIQPELLFSTQGAKSEYTEGFEGFDVNVEENLKLNYINLPIMAKYFVTEKLNIQAGPQVGFLMSAKNDYKASFGGESESEEVDIKDETNSIDFGVNFGLGYDFTENIFVEARYNLGLTDLPKEDSDFKAKNAVFQLSLGYKF